MKEDTKEDQKPVIPIGFIINFWERQDRGTFDKDLYLQICKIKEL
jgi:hypothetical protein